MPHRKPLEIVASARVRASDIILWSVASWPQHFVSNPLINKLWSKDVNAEFVRRGTYEKICKTACRSGLQRFSCCGRSLAVHRRGRCRRHATYEGGAAA